MIIGSGLFPPERLVTRPDAEARVRALNQIKQANASRILMRKGRDENFWDLRRLPKSPIVGKKTHTQCTLEDDALRGAKLLFVSS